MATLACHRPVTDYFSQPRRQSENHTVTPSLFQWDEGLYNDLAFLNSLSCDSINRSLGSASTIPYSNRKYIQSSHKSNIDREPTPSFLPRDFDDWLSGWDETLDSAVSPTVESPSISSMSIPLSPEMASISPRTSIDLTTISNELSDSSVSFEDSITGEPLFQRPEIFQEIADDSLDGLNSTPSSPERPQFSCRVNNRIAYAPLSAAEESRLRSIAMPSQPCPVSPASSSSSDSQDTYNYRKRKSSKSSEVECPPLKHSKRSTSRNTAHNMIEKRYRTNLNDKIATLRDSIPSLRVVAKNSHGEGSQEDLQGLSPALKLNKATILSKAIEYIAHIEKRTECLTKENKDLKARIDAFETLLMAQSSRNSAAPLW